MSTKQLRFAGAGEPATLRNVNSSMLIHSDSLCPKIRLRRIRPETAPPHQGLEAKRASRPISDRFLSQCVGHSMRCVD
jgi:hypothetical protein